MITDVMEALHGRAVTKKEFMEAFFEVFPADALRAYWDKPIVTVTVAFNRLVGEGAINKIGRHHFALNPDHAAPWSNSLGRPENRPPQEVL